MNPDILMNTATALFFICYIPEFYANYVMRIYTMWWKRLFSY
jgi:hypothetical protein